MSYLLYKSLSLQGKEKIVNQLKAWYPLVMLVLKAHRLHDWQIAHLDALARKNKGVSSSEIVRLSVDVLFLKHKGKITSKLIEENDFKARRKISK